MVSILLFPTHIAFTGFSTKTKAALKCCEDVEKYLCSSRDGVRLKGGQFSIGSNSRSES
jgi:hypothetical protein